MRPGRLARLLGGGPLQRSWWTGPRLLHALACVVLVGFSFVQRWGEITFDTKFDLTADPGAFLARTMHLWNPLATFGDLQNQAYGYLFPQGSFFLLLDWLGTPDWIAQRLWSALVLLIGYEGCRRLCRALGIEGGGYAAVIAGFSFATAPRLLGLAGVLSAEVLPTAVLPWVVLPLVLGLRGELSPRRAGLLSGFAVLFMGGVNAVEDLAALPLAFLLVCAGLRRREGRRLAAWWTGATTLACLWWFLPLIVLGRYSPPFLNYIETAAATTRSLGWSNSIRGADHWLAYIFVGGTSWWPGAHDLAATPVLVLLTAVVAGLGYVGLFHRSMPLRLPFALSALLGLVCLTLAHVGPVSSPLDESVQALLDEVLAPLRNVHKVDPLVRLPLALGLANVLSLAWRWEGRTRDPRRAQGLLRDLTGRKRSRVVAVVLVGSALVVLAAARPLLDDGMRKTGWTDIPAAWQQTADYLSAEADGTTIVLPGSGFGQQWWGWTIDEPIQGVASTPWTTRSQVPLIPGPTIRYLDGIESRIESGIGSPSLAATLARAGISNVVIRRDINVFVGDVTAPSRVDDAIRHSPGLELEKELGDSGFEGQAMIEIYRVLPYRSQVAAPWLSSFQHLYGGPEDIITSLEAGVLSAGTPVFIGPGPADVVADGYRRQERQFGRLHDALSQVMTPDEPYRTVRAEHDYPGAPGVERVSAAYSGASLVSASSSSGYVDSLGPIRPEEGPASAVDSDLTTYWRSAPFEDPVGQWLQIDFDHARKVSSAALFLVVDRFTATPVKRVLVEAGGQRREYTVNPFTGRVNVLLDGSAIDSLRITVLETADDANAAFVGIREVQVDGDPIERALTLPDTETGVGSRLVFSSPTPRRACVSTAIGPQCDLTQRRAGPEEHTLSRNFSGSLPGERSVGGQVVALATVETATLLRPLAGGIIATARSVLGDDPSVSGQFTVDGTAATPWISGPGVTRTKIELSWDEPRTLSRLTVDTAAVPGRRPIQAVLRSGKDVRVVDLSSGSLGYFDPFRARQVEVELIANPDIGDGALPMAVGELRFDGLEDLTHRPDPEGPSGAACGFGPGVYIDGVLHKTKVVGTVEDVLRGSPMRMRVCDGDVRLSGEHHILRVQASTQFSAVQIAIGPAERAAPPPTVGQRDLEVLSWDVTDRRVRVGAGPESVLRVAENRNDGWRATLDGKTLDPVVVDGWQQGYVLPEGGAGTVRLVYTPDRPYRIALLVGLVAVLLLVVGLVLDRVRPAPRPATPLTRLHQSLRLPRRRVLGALSSLLALGIGWLAGGPMVAAGLFVGLLVLVLPRRLPPMILLVLSACLVLAAAVISATGSDVAVGRSPVAADACAALAVGILVSCLFERRAPEVDRT